MWLENTYIVINGVRHEISWASRDIRLTSTGAADDILHTITLHEWPPQDKNPHLFKDRHFVAVASRKRKGITRETPIEALTGYLQTFRGVNVQKIAKQWAGLGIKDMGDFLAAYPNICEETKGIGWQTRHKIREFLVEGRLIASE